MSMSSNVSTRPFRALGAQIRVIKALILRDLSSRHEGTSSGLLWTLAEPIIITVIVLLYHWAGGSSHTSSTVPVAAFVLTGYSPHLLLRHTGVAGITAINGNAPLLYHRFIHFTDFVFAKFLLEIFYVFLSFLIIYVAFFGFGILHLPLDMNYFYLGWFLHTWFAFAICLIFTGGGLRWTIVRSIFQPFTYLMIPVYGAFFMLYWLPQKTQYFLLFFPPMDATEILRRGYFGTTVPTHFDIPYTIESCIVLTFIGLLSLLSARHTVEV